jgi:hypothetical protein
MHAEEQQQTDPATEIIPRATGEVMTNATPITLDDGKTAPLGELLACRHRRCPHCSEGWVRRYHGETVVSAVCGCCVLGYRAEQARGLKAANAAQAGAIKVANLRELERQRRRVERLTAEADRLIAERARRVAIFDERNAELIAAAKTATATAQDEASLGLRAEAEVKHLTAMVGEAKKRLEQYEQALGGAESALQAHREGRALALSMQADAEREIERRRDGLNLAALDKDIAKAQRRLGGARIYSGLGEGEPGPAPEAA